MTVIICLLSKFKYQNIRLKVQTYKRRVFFYPKFFCLFRLTYSFKRRSSTLEKSIKQCMPLIKTFNTYKDYGNVVDKFENTSMCF